MQFTSGMQIHLACHMVTLARLFTFTMLHNHFYFQSSIPVILHHAIIHQSHHASNQILYHASHHTCNALCLVPIDNIVNQAIHFASHYHQSHQSCSSHFVSCSSPLQHYMDHAHCQVISQHAESSHPIKQQSMHQATKQSCDINHTYCMLTAKSFHNILNQAIH